MTPVSLYQCSRCGRDTDWDIALSPDPLCVDCWDHECEKPDPIAARKRKYYEAHKKEIALPLHIGSGGAGA